MFCSQLRSLFMLLAVAVVPASYTSAADIQVSGDYTAPNPLINYNGYLSEAAQASKLREQNRLSEEKFIALAKTPGVVILDARSREMFALLHIEGAINLPFPDINEISLAKTIPDKNQIILIYCNNNFAKALAAFAPKRAEASLNISTFIALHTYGYRNIYELGPLLDVHTTKIPLVGERK